MKIDHKALKFALALAVAVPACYINTEKPADSAPPIGSAGAAGAAGAPATATTVTTTTTTVTTTTSAVPTTPPAPVVPPRPPSLKAAPKPAPTTSASATTP